MSNEVKFIGIEVLTGIEAKKGCLPPFDLHNKKVYNVMHALLWKCLGILPI